MKILLIFTLYLISVGGEDSNDVTGYLGGEVLIKCKYIRIYTSNKKYFCKDSILCTNQISTKVKNKWVSEGRFSLIDKPRDAEFWVLITELSVKDSGTYQCGVDIEWEPDDSAEVELKILKDIAYMKSFSVNGHVGFGVNISCNYPQSLISKPKFLCRRLSTTDCDYTVSVKQSKEWIKKERFSLKDERAKKIFTVSFSSVTEEDSGEYWCGAESDWESDRGYKVYFTQVNLRVRETGSPDKSTPSRSFTRQSEKTTLKYTDQPLVTTNTPTTEFPTSSVITAVSVILVLLLIGLFVFIVILRKRLKTRALTPSQSIKDTNTVYEEIKETKRHPKPNTGASTVYSTAQLPTNPSDPSQSLYDNIQSQQGPNPIYSTAPDQNFHSKPQTATSSSGSSERTAEDPAYATVKFTKHYKATTATINKEEEKCDYATVKHVIGSG